MSNQEENKGDYSDSSEQEYEDFMNNSVDQQAHTEAQASLFDTRDQEERLMRSGDIKSPDVALACELNILFKVGDKKVHKQASAQIVKDLGNNQYLALTARTNLFLITKESV